MSSFYPNQIVCLSCQDSALYAEVIQVIADRASIWARPLLLISGDNGDSIDVRDGSDLILPIDLFRPALDTEVLPIFSRVIKNNPSPPPPHYLQNFVRQVCKNYPEYFQKTS
ncbi:hypothetical protein V0288_16675 [Pannus brasiliensis CCIBt3594]|uniref:Uncharacterized protein n=1 Tax=Pannus brasiliensis CCIBt3594 TaxID=1427578 RepID=A0AAW9QZY7_9CHRO